MPRGGQTVPRARFMFSCRDEERVTACGGSPLTEPYCVKDEHNDRYDRMFVMEMLFVLMMMMMMMNLLPFRSHTWHSNVYLADRRTPVCQKNHRAKMF